MLTKKILIKYIKIQSIVHTKLERLLQHILKGLLVC